MSLAYKCLNSRASGILYGAFSLVFLWITTSAVKLYDSYPELFANDEIYIICMLFTASILWYILFVMINIQYVSDRRKNFYTVLFVVFSAVYVITPVISRPELFESMIYVMKSHIQWIL